jgi:hypothetical protein
MFEKCACREIGKSRDPQDPYRTEGDGGPTQSWESTVLFVLFVVPQGNPGFLSATDPLHGTVHAKSAWPRSRLLRTSPGG